jgi:WASH complex subunit 7
LAQLLIVLITLDQIIVNNEALTSAFARYMRMTKLIKAEPSRYSVEEDKLWQTEKLLFSLKGQLLDGLIYQNCIEQEFDFPGLVEVKTNKIFKNEFLANIRALLFVVKTGGGDQIDNVYRDRCVGMHALYAFYMTIFKDPSDKSFFKNLWELTKKPPIINLYANVTWFPAEFLTKLVSGMTRVLNNNDSLSVQKEYTKMIDKELPLKVANLYLQVSRWMVVMESNTSRKELFKILHARSELFLDGLQYAFTIGNLFKNFVGLHLKLSVPMTQTHARCLCQLVELLKAIESTFHRRSSVIGETITLAMKQVAALIEKGLAPIRLRMEGQKTYTDTQLDILAAARLSVSMLSGPTTNERRILLRLAMHVMLQDGMSYLKENDIDELRKALKKLERVCELQSLVREACDCSFLFWSREMVEPYFEDMYQHPIHSQRLHYMLAGLRDILPIFQKSVHVEPAVLINGFKDEIEEVFRKQILRPLCLAIEEDLRFHIHAHLEVSDRDPNKMKELVRFVSIKPVRFFDKTIDIKAHVAHYLDTTFYNLNTVALYDWKTYGEMRNLAEYKYGLNLTEVHLPGATLEQGLDVLEIMRKIHVFVASYNYNLNNQIFIERQSDSKTLNTINITHISNSIRTHGTGIMNTTVNFTFQFLRQKFNVFSQFLYDDHIKSRLYKDIKYFKESRDQLDNKYPVERSHKFNKDIRKLGGSDGLSFLDQFRILITQIGNAMGYIRLIRSGGRNYVANAIKFVPDLQDIVKFEELATKENLPAETILAAGILDNAVDTLSKNFAEGTEYFKILVSVFAGEFRNPQNQHLRNFYMIVPPLTINFIEHILIMKDKLHKKTKNLGNEPLVFTDDGFVIGIAYILKLLDQNKEFDSLHWFDSVKKRYEQDQIAVHNSTKNKSKEDAQTAQITLKKLAIHMQEFDLLKYSFSGARIFFKD